MCVFAATRVIDLVTFAALQHHGIFRVIPSMWNWLAFDFDAGWYNNIAQHGYPPGQVSFVHFYPGYPLATDAIAWLPGVGVTRASIAVATLAGLAAAAGLSRLSVRLTGSLRVSLLVVALWAVAPGAMVFSMAYPEALLCALAAWALVAVADKRWLMAGVLTMLAGTVHSSAVALMAAVGLAALIAIIRSARSGWRPAGSWLRPAAAIVISPLGLIAFWVFVSIQLGSLGAWLATEKAAGTYVDGGVSTTRAIAEAFVRPDSSYNLMFAVVILAGVALAAWVLTERIPAHLKVYVAGNVLLTVLTNSFFFGSKPRYLLPALLLGFPLAKLLAPARSYVLIPLVGILAAASAWFTLAAAAAGIAP